MIVANDFVPELALIAAQRVLAMLFALILLTTLVVVLWRRAPESRQ